METERSKGEAPLSFDLFFEEEYPGLFGTLYLVSGSAEETEDVVQEAFLRVWTQWDRMNEVSDPRAYLYRTGFNVFRTWRRRASRAFRGVLPTGNVDEPFSLVDDRDQLVRALSRLSSQQRASVVLTALLGLRSEEAATLMGIRASTVRVHASRAREHLQRALTGGISDERS